MRRFPFVLLLAVGLVLAACNGGTGQPPPNDDTAADAEGPVTLLAHDSFANGVTAETFAAFTDETGIDVEVLPAGDAGSMVNQAILTKDAPLADALFGIDDSFLSRALDEGVFQPTDIDTSGLLEDLPNDAEGRVIAIDFGDVCLNYDRAVLNDDDVPATLADLADPEFANMLVVESPATSSPGLAFLLATIAEYGEDGWQDYWRSLVDNGAKAVGDWDQAYYTEFSRYGGDRPLVVSYASSPPAEVIFAESPIDEAPTGVIEAGCYRQTEFAGVLSGATRPEGAQLLVEYLISAEFQEQIPLTWFVFPANASVDLPIEFTEHTSVPSHPASIPAAEIDANRERWIDEWTQIVTG